MAIASGFRSGTIGRRGRRRSDFQMWRPVPRSMRVQPAARGGPDLGLVGGKPGTGKAAGGRNELMGMFCFPLEEGMGGIG